MIACERCHRLRRPGGLHICLEKALAARASTPRPPAVVPSRRLETSERGAVTSKTHVSPEKLIEAPRHIGAFKLPGNGDASRIWNALVEGRR